jgi:hypothetical protein
MAAAYEAFLAARVLSAGRAIRRTTLRHTFLARKPFGLALFRLGGERFRAAAVAWGDLSGNYKLAVTGDPRNRDLYFAALLPFAKDLCRQVRRAMQSTEELQRGSQEIVVPKKPPQIIVPNKATVSAVALLGRYLAYLSDMGGVRPDPALIEAGKYLRIYANSFRVPGQSLIVPVDTLLNDHWATLLSPVEQSNLAAVAAQVWPPKNTHCYLASIAAEKEMTIGPEPTEQVDRAVAPLLETFNRRRAGSTSSDTVARLIGPLRRHYDSLLKPVWRLMQRAVALETKLPAAPSALRRWTEDRVAIARHFEHVLRGGRLATRDTARQAAAVLRAWEDSLRRYEAEKATEDPACMIPYLLEGTAIQGKVVEIEINKVRPRVRRATIRVEVEGTVTLPTGKELWWSETADDHCWEVTGVHKNGDNSVVTLMLNAKPTAARLPKRRQRMTLSCLRTGPIGFQQPLPRETPWTHVAAFQEQEQVAIDEGDGDAEVLAPIE